MLTCYIHPPFPSPPLSTPPNLFFLLCGRRFFLFCFLAQLHVSMDNPTKPDANLPHAVNDDGPAVVIAADAKRGFYKKICLSGRLQLISCTCIPCKSNESKPSFTVFRSVGRLAAVGFYAGGRQSQQTHARFDWGHGRFTLTHEKNGRFTLTHVSFAWGHGGSTPNR